MEEIYSSGKTIFLSYIHPRAYPIPISVLSQRAATLVLRRSDIGKWKKRVMRYGINWTIDDFLIVGFQPESGLHIAIKKL